MKEELSPHEQYQANKKWAHEIASDLGVELDKEQEHFVIPVYDEQGKEIRRELVPTWKTIPLATEKGKQKDPPMPIETVIKAIKKYPNLTLREAAKKLESEG